MLGVEGGAHRCALGDGDAAARSGDVHTGGTRKRVLKEELASVPGERADGKLERLCSEELVLTPDSPTCQFCDRGQVTLFLHLNHGNDMHHFFMAFPIKM